MMEPKMNDVAFPVVVTEMNGAWSAKTSHGELLLNRMTKVDAISDGQTVFNWLITMSLKDIIDKCTPVQTN
ncbi:MAG: hypothetical protein NUW00_03540 [Candidatus Kaiserbacteria bacterium]|nr:hypothetical protein [Candidatus Kaiserbacteria bacterium]MCR4330430.1 hypothetical protein [Patescibacteria group bacterium]